MFDIGFNCVKLQDISSWITTNPYQRHCATTKAITEDSL